MFLVCLCKMTGLGAGMGEEPESIEWLIEGQAFWRSFDSAPRPPPPPLQSVSFTSDTQEDRQRKRVNLLMGEGGKWWAWSQIRQPQDSLAFYKSLNPLCLYCMRPSAELSQLAERIILRNIGFCFWKQLAPYYRSNKKYDSIYPAWEIIVTIRLSARRL
jgi:hypothetical protein